MYNLMMTHPETNTTTRHEPETLSVSVYLPVNTDQARVHKKTCCNLLQMTASHRNLRFNPAGTKLLVPERRRSLCLFLCCFDIALICSFYHSSKNGLQ